MKVNVVVPPLSATKFSGGILCVMQYAHGLYQNGHEVSVIPLVPSAYPHWFAKPFGHFVTLDRTQRLQLVFSSGGKLLTSVRAGKSGVRSSIRDGFQNILYAVSGALAGPLAKGAAMSYLESYIPQADVTLATSFETALPVALYGTGRLYYFLQHYEPYFKDEYAVPWQAEREATLSYRLGLEMIANSSWLKSKISSEYPDSTVRLCPNAIDHTIFNGQPVNGSDSGTITVISYGGRNAAWKGFKEMAQAISIVRRSLPDINVRWLVYGDALLPPDNTIASFEHLGFLQPTALANAYRQADILLSASWYESFPLFPIEAMASGLAVITTQAGTEEYARHGETAEIVQPQKPESIADGLIHLIRNPEYRRRIAAQGNRLSKEFTWDRSVRTMERILAGQTE